MNTVDYNYSGDVNDVSIQGFGVLNVNVETLLSRRKNTSMKRNIKHSAFMSTSARILIGFCVFLFLFSFPYKVYGKEHFVVSKLTHTPDTSINLSTIQVSDTTVYFSDSYGVHYQCDYPVQTKGFIKVSDSTRIWIEIEGKGSPLLLIQGGPGYDHRYFHPYFSELASEHTLIYTDLRGRYMSDVSDTNKYSFMQDINDLEDIRKQLGIQQWNVLGHSYGGYITMMYAQLHPQSIKSAITVATPLGYTKSQNDSNTTMLIEKYFGDISKITREENFKALINMAFYSKPEDAKITYFLHALSDYGNYDKFDIFMKYYLNHNDDNNITYDKYIGDEPAGKNLSLLSMPFMVIAGKEDGTGFWQETEQLIKEKQPHATIHLFDKSAHYPFIEEKEKFMQIVKEWLRLK